MKKQEIKKAFFGIRKQVVWVVTVVCGIIFLLTYAGVNYVVKDNISDFLTEQYSYLNDKLIGAFNNTYSELDELTADFVTNEYVQQTLKNTPLDSTDREMLRKTLSYYNKSFLDSYLVVDNKENFYSLKDVWTDYEEFEESEICRALGEEYSRTKILWTRDTLFGSNEMSFFTVRYIREMDSRHEPGVLVLKLKDSIMDEVRSVIDNRELVYFIEDTEGEICFEAVSDEDSEKWRLEYEEARAAAEKSGRRTLAEGIISEKTDEATGFKVITFAPGSVTNRIIREVQAVMVLLFIGGYALMLVVILFLAKKLTDPIQEISTVMREFDDSKLDRRISLSTNTELDDIGHAYNGMLTEVKDLMEAVRHKEQELKESELQTMLYQIRPHFLYNTLDTIYMLARIQKEDTIMNMIQALSKFLRINLSNGKDCIEVEKELEHVSAYLDIQKVRNADLFDYQVETEPGMEHVRIAKMILQPVAENCIKYGFRDIYSGGMIRIRAYTEEEYYCFSIENNGTPVDEKQAELLNKMEAVPMEEVDLLIQKKKGGFGICNVVKRLRMRYDGQIRFYYIRKDEGTECVIKIKKECAE